MTGFATEQKVIVPSAEGRDRERWLTAVHEAGHAAVALLLDIGCHSVSVVDGRQVDSSAGRIFGLRRGTPKQAAVYTLAGAEAALAAGDGVAYAASVEDIAQAIVILAGERLALGMHFGGPLFGLVAESLGELERARKEAAALVLEYWPEIARGAAALYDRGTLSGTEFAAAAGGRLTGLAVVAKPLAAADEPTAPEYVPAAECLQCGWHLDVPYRVYRSAMSGDELVAWLAHVRPQLCRPDYVEATAPVALGDAGADALGLAEPAAADFAQE